MNIGIQEWKVACDYCAHVYTSSVSIMPVFHIQDRKICGDCIVIALDKLLGTPILRNEDE